MHRQPQGPCSSDQVAELTMADDRLTVPTALDKAQSVYASLKNAVKNTLAFRIWRGHPTFRFTEIAKARVARVLLPQRLSVGWMLCGGEEVGSSRIHGINLHRYLRAHGVSSFVINEPHGYVETLEIDDHSMDALLRCEFDVVVFQRVHNGRALELIERLKASKTRTAFFVADLYETNAYRQTDYVLTVSDQLKAALIERGVSDSRIFVVPDAIETDLRLCKTYAHSSALTKIVWIGAAGHWHTLDHVRTLVEFDARFKDFRLVTISNHPNADLPWDLASVWGEILKCDIGIVPVDLGVAEATVKSNNRVTMFKALGLPVICSRIPAYEQAIVDGQTGFIANTPEDWVRMLLVLGDASERQRIGLAGRDSAFDQYGIERIGADFCSLLHEISGHKQRIGQTG